MEKDGWPDWLIYLFIYLFIDIRSSGDFFV